MKHMSIMIFATLFSSVYSMELVPFLKKEENKMCLVRHVLKSLSLPKKVRNVTMAYMARLEMLNLLKKPTSQDLDRLQEKIHMLSESIEYADTINKYGNIMRGSAAGTYAGCMSGTTAMSTYGIADGCLWCWCNITIPKITCNMIMCGIASCGCLGCMIGSCCMITSCAEKIGCIR